MPIDRAAAKPILDEVQSAMPVPSEDHNAYILGSMRSYNIFTVCLRPVNMALHPLQMSPYSCFRPSLRHLSLITIRLNNLSRLSDLLHENQHLINLLTTLSKVDRKKSDWRMFIHNQIRLTSHRKTK
jgi:hypothetical protein